MGTATESRAPLQAGIEPCSLRRVTHYSDNLFHVAAREEPRRFTRYTADIAGQTRTLWVEIGATDRAYVIAEFIIEAVQTNEQVPMRRLATLSSHRYHLLLTGDLSVRDEIICDVHQRLALLSRS